MNDVYFKKDNMESWIAKYFADEYVSIDDVFDLIERLDYQIYRLKDETRELKDEIRELKEKKEFDYDAWRDNQLAQGE